MKRIITIVLAAILVAACAVTAVIAFAGGSGVVEDRDTRLDNLEKEIIAEPITYVPKASYAAKDLYPAYEEDQTAELRAKEIYQIGAEALAELKTEELCEYVLYYPYLSTALFESGADWMQKVYETKKANFDGFAELTERADASHYLLKRYLSLPSYTTAEECEGVDPEDFFMPEKIEFLLFREAFCSGLTDDEYLLFVRKYCVNVALRENSEYKTNSMNTTDTNDASVLERFANAKKQLGY